MMSMKFCFFLVKIILYVLLRKYASLMVYYIILFQKIVICFENKIDNLRNKCADNRNDVYIMGDESKQGDNYGYAYCCPQSPEKPANEIIENDFFH